MLNIDVMAVYRTAVAEGAVAMGQPVGSGRKSAVTAVADALGISQSTAYRRMQTLLDAQRTRNAPDYQPVDWTYTRERHLNLSNATVLVGGDMHKWPLARVPESPIQAAFRKVAETVKPDAIILNGDLIDGTRISRHPGIRAQNPPKVLDELTAASDYVASLPKATHQHITMSNHDVRIDNYLANQAPELEDCALRMTDRLPGWDMAYTIAINPRTNGHTDICHNWHSGMLAGRNNAIKSGVHYVTNHTHGLGVSAIDDRRGRRYGVECGMLSHPYEPQFEYTWNRPTRWMPGFVLLTYDHNGDLLQPETCEFLNGRAVFRGAAVDIKPRYRVPSGSASVGAPN